MVRNKRKSKPRPRRSTRTRKKTTVTRRKTTRRSASGQFVSGTRRVDVSTVRRTPSRGGSGVTITRPSTATVVKVLQARKRRARQLSQSFAAQQPEQSFFQPTPATLDEPFTRPLPRQTPGSRTVGRQLNVLTRRQKLAARAGRRVTPAGKIVGRPRGRFELEGSFP